MEKRVNKVIVLLNMNLQDFRFKIELLAEYLNIYTLVPRWICAQMDKLYDLRAKKHQG